MSSRIVATHAIEIALPVDQCQRLFTPAGEELWVDGWQPRYIYPPDGRTEEGMVFTTGAGDEFALWNLVDFDTASHYAKYSRVTPASRSAVVEVRCAAIDGRSTSVSVTYTLTALSAQGDGMLASFGDGFVAMIEEWRSSIEARLPELEHASIR